MKESRHTRIHHVWMSHGAYGWVMSHLNESCFTWMSQVVHEWVVAHMNESRHTCMHHVSHEWVMSHTNESYHIYEWVMSHIWMSHVTLTWATSWRASHMNESRRTHERVMSHMNTSRLTWTWLIHVFYVSHLKGQCHAEHRRWQIQKNCCTSRPTALQSLASSLPLVPLKNKKKVHKTNRDDSQCNDAKKE